MSGLDILVETGMAALFLIPCAVLVVSMLAMVLIDTTLMRVRVKRCYRRRRR